MKYFKYQTGSGMGRVWSLFVDLTKVDIDREDDSIEHTMEIIKSAMNGNLDPSDFNLKLYEESCKKRSKIQKDKTREKFLSIVDTANSEDEKQSVGYGEISLNSKALSIEDAFEEVERRDEFEKNLESIFSMRKEYLRKYGVDIVEMLKNSLKGIPEAVQELRKLLLDDEILKATVEELCLTGDLLQSLEKRGGFK